MRKYNLSQIDSSYLTNWCHNQRHASPITGRTTIASRHSTKKLREIYERYSRTPPRTACFPQCCSASCCGPAFAVWPAAVDAAHCGDIGLRQPHALLSSYHTSSTYYSSARNIAIAIRRPYAAQAEPPATHPAVNTICKRSKLAAYSKVTAILCAAFSFLQRVSSHSHATATVQSTKHCTSTTMVTHNYQILYNQPTQEATITQEIPTGLPAITPRSRARAPTHPASYDSARHKAIATAQPPSVAKASHQRPQRAEPRLLS